VWLINQDVGPQLHLMTLGIGTAGQVVYMPPGGLSSAPYATLMGAPVIETEWNATLGTVGDILLVDMSQWVSISKGGMESATSMHVYFTTDEQAFRTTFRVDAQPWWASVLTPFKGSNTQAPAISLATRA
jgi:HK97 family phage major capsid protein